MSVVGSKAPNAAKGNSYIQQLDQALCDGNWANVPELARKVDKHAPDRKCLTLTARAEAQIASSSHRPTSANSTASGSIHSLGELIPKLQEAADAVTRHQEDAYAARVCLAEIHWLQENNSAALQALPESVPESQSSDGQTVALGLLELSTVKAMYISAVTSESIGNVEGAKTIYRTAASQTPSSRTPELRRWTERLFARSCTHHIDAGQSRSIAAMSDALQSYRSWADFWQRSPPPSSGSGQTTSRLDIPRRSVWRAYYDILSTILQYGLVYNPSPSSSEDLLVQSASCIPENELSATKSRQRAELARIEKTYESLLLNETQFPKASETNREVEEWVEQVVANWHAFGGIGWTDAEIDAGGKESISRTVLDILYRAATKTFHSTSILRQLFTVHASLGEFDLAMHAFDSYSEIVSRGKSRAEKTGTHELGFDDDDTALLTAAEAIRVLCKYGDREQAEKAMVISGNIEKWMSDNRPHSTETANSSSRDNPKDGNASDLPTESQMRSSTLAAAYRAIGISKAHWARLTYDAESRPELQADALKYLRRAEGHDPVDLDTAHSLAVNLAETRNVSGAIGVLKRALSRSADVGQSVDDESAAGHFRERQLVPLWHLLALCCSAKDDYDTAAEMCEAAFEQFGDHTVLFGQPAQTSSNPEKADSASKGSKGIVDWMEGFEKAGILQVKMTQMALIELMEGPGAAVDMSDELLGLYAKLFGKTEQSQTPSKPPPTATTMAPPKTGGRLRSLAGSIRGTKSTRNSQDGNVTGSPNQPSRLSAGSDGKLEQGNGQANGAPIAITVTNEDGVHSKGERHHHRHPHLPFRTRGHQGDFREAGNLKQSNENLRSIAMSEQTQPPNQPLENDHANDLAPINSAVTNSTSADGIENSQHRVKSIEHNMPHSELPRPTGHDDQPPSQDVRLPAPHPASAERPSTCFPSAQERRHKISLLVEIWLFIAGLYLRADLFDDAKGAVDEAFKLVEAFEVEIATEHSSAKHLFEKGWGGGKGVDALWGDVWAARGDLSTARNLPFLALENYEQALAHSPDHPEAITSLSTLLLDQYDRALPIEPPAPSILPNPQHPAPQNPLHPSSRKDPSPALLNRLAARDRAYMLLQNLTRLGVGWDDSEAWAGFARALEAGGQVDRAKRALWWVLELEEARGVRGWGVIGFGR
ncbi:hypothetical protein MBLNU230_g2725t1 [Neophaeotheca triangularis]